MNEVTMIISVFGGFMAFIGLIAVIWMKLEERWFNKHSTHNKRTRSIKKQIT